MEYSKKKDTMICVLAVHNLAHWRAVNSEAVDNFVIHFSNLIVGLSIVSEVILENKVLEKLLKVIPKRLSMVVVAIDVTANLATVILKDAPVSKLC